MKALILTYAPIAKAEKEVLIKTDIYKLALNHHAAEFNPNARIITDYVLPKICQKFPNDKIISVREKLRCKSNRVEYFDCEFKGSTILSAIEYLINKGFDSILIVGDNKVNSIEFRETVNREIDKIKHSALLYQYTNGNYNLPVKSISEFCIKKEP